MRILMRTPKMLSLTMAASLSVLLLMQACADPVGRIAEIRLTSPAGNALRVRAEVQTADTLDAFIEYWLKGREGRVFTTPVSAHAKTHVLTLTNLLPSKTYAYQVVTTLQGVITKSKVYDFHTSDYPAWLKDQLRVVCPDTTVLPAAFRQGYIMVYKREEPGILYLLNAKGDIVWYQQANGTGFKVAGFTRKNTLLSLMGNAQYETSYGNEILELSLAGDTLLHLKKGEGDFKQTIHHEVLLNAKDQVVTLCVEERIVDLRAKGGTQRDTVKGDGILVLDRQGKQVWKWTVFDVLDPLKEPHILKEKQDWMHANCVTFDRDGNYLISFYNNGQIWKINAATGELMWKFGKNGDFNLPADAIFDQAHAIHINRNGELLFFDNGVSKKESRTLSFHVEEAARQAQLVINTKLPREFYNERMGSSYLLNDTTLLICASKRNTVILSNLQGRFLWSLKMGMSSYRAEFIPAERVEPFLSALNN